MREVAYGAALSLIHFRDHLTESGRLAWANANNQLSHVGQTGIQRTKQGYFLVMMNQLRLQTYGTGFDDASVSHQAMLATTPWAQTDAEFQMSMNYINTGQIPDEAKFVTPMLSKDEQVVFDQVSKSLRKEAAKWLERGAIAVGGAAVAAFFKIKNLSVVGVATDIAWELIKSRLQDLEKQDVIARFRVDEQRRKHLVDIGQSTYRATT